MKLYDFDTVMFPVNGITGTIIIRGKQ